MSFVFLFVQRSQLTYGGLGLNINQDMQRMLAEKSDELHTAVSMDDLHAALSKVSKSVSEQDLKRYAEWMEEFGSA